MYGPVLLQFGADFHDLSRLADLATSLTSGDSSALQAVLEQLAVPERCGAGQGHSGGCGGGLASMALPA